MGFFRFCDFLQRHVVVEPASDSLIQYFSQKKTVKMTGLNITKRLVLTVAFEMNRDVKKKKKKYLT